MTNEEKLIEDLKNFRINIGDEYVTIGSWRLTDSEASNIAAYLARKGWVYNQDFVQELI